ncbi:hypothetical protein FRC06_000673 [Ceratobasidium sp. 370]|nr:hypothetical protein FRC06_000673 [Ceratobasidium sp. 370]
MLLAQDLQHFKKGVTKVKIWAGHELRDMMRQFLPVVIDAQAPPRMVQLIRALLDCSYLAHGVQLTKVKLGEMDKALAVFHEAKYVLTDKKMMKGPAGFNRMPKLHMLGHYARDIRELGTPDGYSTETAEHLHIVYVKIPWWMSNWRNLLPQMVQYVQRLEALEIQRVFLEEYYGEPLELGIKDIYMDEEDEDKDISEDKTNSDSGKDVDSDEHDSDEEDGDEDDGDEMDGDEDDGDEMDGVEVSVLAKLAESEVHYPRPGVLITQRLTVLQVAGHVIIASYGTSDFIRAVRCFLTLKNALPPGERLILLPSDRFNVWHKAVLNHSLLPFVPGQPCHRDVLRAHPPIRDAASHITKPGTFDTGLFPVDRAGHGLLHRPRSDNLYPPTTSGTSLFAPSGLSGALYILSTRRLCLPSPVQDDPGILIQISCINGHASYLPRHGVPPSPQFLLAADPCPASGLLQDRPRS